MKDSASGKRLVAFGHFAGNAGMIDALYGLGHRFLGFGYSTPYMVGYVKASTRKEITDGI